jgi:phosphomannomutase
MSALIAERYGATCHMSAVGEANVVDMMLSTGAVLGGEGNGGVIDPRVGLVRDSFVAMAVVLDQMVARNQSVESLSQLLPHLEMRKLKIELDPSKLSAVLEALRMRYPNATESRLDGLRLEWSHQWLLVRGSNTEPVVRMIAEGADSNGVDELITEATAVVQVCANSGESVQKDHQTGP